MNPVSLASRRSPLLQDLFTKHPELKVDLSRSDVIEHILRRREAIETKTGALAVWNPPKETGRIPNDTYMVLSSESEEKIDWNSSACNPMTSEVFDRLFEDAVAVLSNKRELFGCRKSIGAESSYALGVQVISDSALPMLFADNMFRPALEDAAKSIFGSEECTLLVLPHDKIDVGRYSGALREENGVAVDMCIAMDFERKLGIVYGLSYLGAIKKLMFTMMNYLLPEQGILPLHCSANEDEQGNTALFLGLSGTGKTTLSNHPGTRLIGDDEHGWGPHGIANFENGCYAKLINLDAEKEPNIYKAAFTERPTELNGVILENAVVYPSGSWDVTDSRLAENSRTSYPLSVLADAKPESVGTHPKAIVFLTADAKGVLPPVARLSEKGAMLWFLMGYTSKLAGVEVGIKEPVSSFSRFFGGPFMPLKPSAYLELLGDLMQEHSASVYLVNTGWTGGAYGTGERMDIAASRSIIEAVLTGTLDNASYREDTRFHFSVPLSCNGVDADLLDPASNWSDKEAYERSADQLAAEFAAYFDANYSSVDLPEGITESCPGK